MSANLFESKDPAPPAVPPPLADRMRPRSLDQVIGQQGIVGPGCVLQTMVNPGPLRSVIFWGPPGCGKTTLARLLADLTDQHFVEFSAVTAGVKEVRATIESARQVLRAEGRATVLFVDEIHRFNKAQQDAFLHQVEEGLLTLIGATTENPSFEVNAALLSRCRVVPLEPLDGSQLIDLAQRALSDPERGLGSRGLTFDDNAAEFLAEVADGDARRLLNSLELAAMRTEAQERRAVSVEDAQEAIGQRVLRYDKGGDEHYHLISALHKSLRGSDTQASVYWLGRMLEAGEDPMYIARRMVRFASEDIGNADPQALQVALNAREAAHFLGMPEANTALTQAAVYLATAPKSNATYLACHAVRDEIRKSGNRPVPVHLRNAPTKLMKDLNYGRDYAYPHDHEEAKVKQEYLPEGVRERGFYAPTRYGFEKEIAKRMEYWGRSGES